MFSSRRPFDPRSGPTAADHALLASAAAVRQARTPTARAAATLDRPAATVRGAPATLVEVIRAGEAKAAGGSFHSRIARQP